LLARAARPLRGRSGPPVPPFRISQTYGCHREIRFLYFSRRVPDVIFTPPPARLIAACDLLSFSPSPLSFHVSNVEIVLALKRLLACLRNYPVPPKLRPPAFFLFFFSILEFLGRVPLPFDVCIMMHPASLVAFPQPTLSAECPPLIC